MKPLTQDELLPHAEYERAREEFRRRIIALKARRRLSVGDKMTLVFENRETIRFQVQEMVRTEHIVDPPKIQEELDVYNALLPEDGELSATLFIEITDNRDIERDLNAFRGIDAGQTLAIKAGDQMVYGEFEQGRSHEQKISAVHFVKFKPSASWVQALASPRLPISVVVTHPGYCHEAAVPADMREEWLKDLRR